MLGLLTKIGHFYENDTFKIAYIFVKMAFFQKKIKDDVLKKIHEDVKHGTIVKNHYNKLD